MAKIKLDKLKKELDSKYKSPAIKEILKFEKDRLNTLSSLKDNSLSKSAINDLQTTLKSTIFQNEFKVAEDYKKYVNPILESIQKNDYRSLHQELEKTITPYIKTETQSAIAALGYTQKSLAELTNNDYIGVDKYSADINSALKNMDINNNLLMSSKALIEAMKKTETEMFQDKMEKLNAERLEVPRMMEPRKIPKNPMIQQNNQIIELLDLQNETLISVAKYISSQNEKLDTQNKIVEVEIKNNKKSAKQAFWTAIASIAIAILATIGAILVSYDIYKKEDKSNNMQHIELLQLINKNDKLDLTKKQNEILNNILKAIERQSKNNKKINKVK